MLTTVEGIYKNGSVELAEKPEGIRGARVLVTFLSPETTPAAKSFQTLYGAWRGKFPENLDVDAALNKIRVE